MIITIDGPIATGKSSIAKKLAHEIGFIYVDTGAMYRAIALFFLRNGVSFTNEAEIKEALQKINLRFEYNPSTEKSDMILNGENVEILIREMQVSSKVSEVAAIGAVRDFAVAQQQAMGVEKGIVMDGRDIGTVVFPNAALKIFVTADPQVRANRRLLELKATNPTITLQEVAENLQHRDLIDSTREHSPLKKADDALVLDNTNLDRAAQFEIALNWAKERIARG